MVKRTKLFLTAYVHFARSSILLQCMHHICQPHRAVGVLLGYHLTYEDSFSFIYPKPTYCSTPCELAMIFVVSMPCGYGHVKTLTDTRALVVRLLLKSIRRVQSQTPFSTVLRMCIPGLAQLANNLRFVKSGSCHCIEWGCCH